MKDSTEVYRILFVNGCQRLYPTKRGAKVQFKYYNKEFSRGFSVEPKSVDELVCNDGKLIWKSIL